MNCSSSLHGGDPDEPAISINTMQTANAGSATVTAFLLMPHWTKRFVQPAVHGSYKKLEWRGMTGVMEH